MRGNNAKIKKEDIMNSIVKRNNLLFSQWPLFDDFLIKEVFNPQVPGQQKIAFPAVNIKELEKAWELEVVVPGIRKEEMSIDVENNKLVISAQRNESSENQGSFSKREYIFSGFTRSFTFSDHLV